jgi:hypothetical protein
MAIIAGRLVWTQKLVNGTDSRQVCVDTEALLMAVIAGRLVWTQKLCNGYLRGLVGVDPDACSGPGEQAGWCGHRSLLMAIIAGRLVWTQAC